MGDDAVLQLEGGLSGIVGIGGVVLALFIPSVRNMRRAEGTHRLHLAEQVVQHIAQVASI